MCRCRGVVLLRASMSGNSHLPVQVTQYFPRGEQNVSFKWKDYCPSIFSRLRDTFGIDNKDYLLSLTGDQCASLPLAHLIPVLHLHFCTLIPVLHLHFCIAVQDEYAVGVLEDFSSLW